MTEAAPVVHVAENSPEHVAYRLLMIIASNEKKSLHGSMGSPATADRKWLLDTYAECLAAVSGKRRGPVNMISETTSLQEAADIYAKMIRPEE